jgi:hypothetical protein
MYSQVYELYNNELFLGVRMDEIKNKKNLANLL